MNRHRYEELRWFCRQYPEKRAEASALIGGTGRRLDRLPHGGGHSDPVLTAVTRREKLLHDIQIIEDCAQRVQGGKWYRALMENVCNGIAYDKIDTAIMPTSTRNKFFKAREQFFELLDEVKE